MFDSMQLLDDETRLPKFHQFLRDTDGKTHRIHAYVTYNKLCPCKCSFCRNEHFSNDIKTSNVANLRRNLKIFSPYIHSITFGGGEPLLVMDDLFETIQKVYYENGKLLDNTPRKYMITSGLKKPFLKNLKDIFFYFDKIYLTRQRVSDKENQKAFKTKVPILTTDNLRNLGYDINSDIEIVSTCYKNGGIDNPNAIIDLIKWTAFIGSETIIFNDLQFDVTDAHYYYEHQIDDDVFESVIQYLERHGFTQRIEVCFSGGYTIRMFKGYLETKNILNHSGWHISVGFKQYHKPGTTLDIWKGASKRTFDLSIMPNGEVFTDWANKNSANSTNNILL